MRKFAFVILFAFACSAGFCQTKHGESLHKSPRGVSVTEYGAIPDDGLDDYTAIQAAANALQDGGELFFPYGDYNLIASGVRIVGKGKASVRGAGRGTRLISHFSGRALSIVPTIPGSALFVSGQGFSVRDLSFIATGAAQVTGTALFCQQAFSGEIRNCTFKSDILNDLNGFKHSIVFDQCYFCTIDTCVIVSPPDSWGFESEGLPSNDLTFSQVWFTDSGINLASCTECLVTMCDFEPSRKTNMCGNNNRFIANRFEQVALDQDDGTNYTTQGPLPFPWFTVNGHRCQFYENVFTANMLNATGRNASYPIFMVTGENNQIEIQGALWTISAVTLASGSYGNTVIWRAPNYGWDQALQIYGTSTSIIGLEEGFTKVHDLSQGANTIIWDIPPRKVVNYGYVTEWHGPFTSIASDTGIEFWNLQLVSATDTAAFTLGQVGATHSYEVTVATSGLPVVATTSTLIRATWDSDNFTVVSTGTYCLGAWIYIPASTTIECVELSLGGTGTRVYPGVPTWAMTHRWCQQGFVIEPSFYAHPQNSTIASMVFFIGDPVVSNHDFAMPTYRTATPTYSTGDRYRIDP